MHPLSPHGFRASVPPVAGWNFLTLMASLFWLLFYAL